jgi:hypothetical protein
MAIISSGSSHRIFQNIEDYGWFKEKNLSKVETLLYGILIDQPNQIEFDKVWADE